MSYQDAYETSDHLVDLRRDVAIAIVIVAVAVVAFFAGANADQDISMPQAHAGEEWHGNVRASGL